MANEEILEDVLDLVAEELEREDVDFELVDMLMEFLEDVMPAEANEVGPLPPRFNPDDPQWTAFEWKETFRFQKADMQRLCDALQLPAVMTATCRTTWTGFDGLCVVLRRLSYPSRLKDIVGLFGRPKCELSVIFNGTIRFLYEHWRALLTELLHPWFTPERLEEFAEVISAKCALQNCWGFIDGTVRPMCRPMVAQRLFYNGHKRVHSLKFQSVVAPNGLIVNLHGPVEGRRHDSFLLRDSQLMPQLEAHMNRPDPPPGSPAIYSLYGDPAYPMRAHLLSPFRADQLTPEEQAFNTQMSAVRTCVEWEFGKLLQLFAFVDFKKNLKVLLQPVASMYVVSALLANCHKCLYGSQTATFFSSAEHEIRPPPLEEYLEL